MNNLIVSLVVAVGLLGGFYAGARYGQAHPTAAASGSGASAASAGGGAGGAGGAGGGTRSVGGGGGTGAGTGATALSGRITAVSGDTITVHDRATNKDVKVDVGSARITKPAAGDRSDLKADATVTVLGQPGTGGVVDAQQVSVGVGVSTGAGGRGRPSASPSPGG